MVVDARRAKGMMVAGFFMVVDARRANGMMNVVMFYGH